MSRHACEPTRLRPKNEWHEDYGCVLWWYVTSRGTIEEPPTVGYSHDYPDPEVPHYANYWSDLPRPELPALVAQVEHEHSNLSIHNGVTRT